MFLLLILVSLHNQDPEIVYPDDFLKQDLGVCLQGLMNGTAIYGSCSFVLQGFSPDLENPLCASFRGEILLQFLTSNHDQILIMLDSYNDTMLIDFSSWHNCGPRCTSCDVSYKPGFHVTATSVTSQLLASRQIMVLKVDNYNYRDCFSNDQTLDVFIEKSRVVFVAQLHPSYKCSMIPMSMIVNHHLTLIYLDSSTNKLKKFLEKSIKPASSILIDTLVTFHCEGECYSNYYSLVSSPFVFLYMIFNISLGNKYAILTNRLFGLSTANYYDCFSDVRAVVSAKTVSVYISRTISTTCPFTKTHDNMPINSLSPELLISGFKSPLDPVRFTSPSALNLVDGKGVLVYNCSTCISMIHKGKTTLRVAEELFQSSLISDFVLAMHLDNGSTDMARYPVNVVELVDWDTASVTVMSFLLMFNASNTILRENSAVGTNCTHVQLIFAPNRKTFQEIFFEGIEKENITILMPLEEQAGSLYASTRCSSPVFSTTASDSCHTIINSLSSQNNMVYYQLMNNTRACGKIYPIDEIIISNVFGPNLKLYGIVLGVFFIAITFLFVCLIAIERYNSVNKSQNSQEPQEASNS
ncbi:Hypothetical protein GLP15_4134 [Giardia lamblia P15]|uniref:Uncharacterized protein n=1 Tax=Giardia intestinalis (strain P15) TaxID=658858 RepID=E1F0I3_GIAIA|nr:Hypothetical protein GLP15_4134 [Giardia lamblia P15]